MALMSYVTVGAPAYKLSPGPSATLTITPPAHTAGDMLLYVVGLHGTKVMQAPVGLGSIPSAAKAGGGGTFGASAGPSKIYFWTMLGTGVLSSKSFPGSVLETNAVAWGVCLAFRGTGSNKFTINGSTGEDVTPGSPFTSALVADPGSRVGDMIIAAACTGQQAATFSSPTYTASGLVCPMTEIVQPASVNGFTVRGLVSVGVVTAGEATSVPVFSANMAGTTNEARGPIGVVSMRDWVEAPVAMMA